jgi:ABC-2 type transport system ATP-binding protein
MSIVVNKVYKTYGVQNALDDVSFEINNGEIVGFIGPNGAGKSTMMKIICGYLPPSSGHVEVNGIDVTEDTLKIRQHIGYLPENNPLYHDMYVKEYLEYVAGIYKIGKKTRNVIDDIIERTGLSPEKHKRIGQLSKGYRQRVGLAQALIHDPRILILDEPTTGLDPNQIKDMRALIKEAGKDKTIMLSTHIMQEVEAICDRVIIINQGKIVANDSTHNLQNKSVSKNEINVIVEFDKSLDESTLSNIKFVTKTLKINSSKWILQNTEGKDIRSDLFEFAVSNSLKVLEMRVVEKTLEDIFHELTTSKK